MQRIFMGNVKFQGKFLVTMHKIYIYQPNNTKEKQFVKMFKTDGA